ncbi:MAG: hypothetical protein M3Q23_11660 [Actinomycetota bacterium]|nr:hypothetical protein [Actinomycetota bacterium]
MNRKRLVVGAALLLALLPACGGTDRPEGVVERWLISLNQGAAGRPSRYAVDAFSERILPGWRGRDPGDLVLIEVGKGELVHRPYGIGGKGQSAPEFTVVPLRVERVSGRQFEREAIVAEVRGTLRIVAMGTLEPGLLVPSQGGQRVGGATIGQWLAGVGVGVALALLVVALMRLVPKPAPLPRRE